METSACGHHRPDKDRHRFPVALQQYEQTAAEIETFEAKPSEKRRDISSSSTEINNKLSREMCKPKVGQYLRSETGVCILLRAG